MELIIINFHFASQTVRLKRPSALLNLYYPPAAGTCKESSAWTGRDMQCLKDFRETKKDSTEPSILMSVIYSRFELSADPFKRLLG